MCLYLIKSLKKEQHHLLIIYTLYRDRAVVAMLVTIYVLAILVFGGAQAQQQQDEEKQSCNNTFVSRAEFEAQQREIESLQRELKYWQNTTVEILKKHAFDNSGGDSNNCPVDDNSFLKDGIEELNKVMSEIVNQTKGVDTRLASVEDKIESIEDKTESIENNTKSVEDKTKNIEQEISQLSNPPLGSFLNPASSCKLIPQGSPSGLFWIQHTGTGYANLEYCDMTRTCCNSTGGWMRVANLNMTDTNQQCPSEFRLITSPKRTCGTPGRSCVSTTFPLNGVKYSKVCGKIIAYQYGSPDAFNPYYNNRGFTVDNGYVDGVSLTHGQTPRKHIWTFAAALDETRSAYWVCPCTKTDATYTGVVPPFIGQDYFCDTGSRYRHQAHQFYSADPLWDGSGCGSTSSCCGFNNPPWFCKQLPQPTTDDIEMRVCLTADSSNENIALETVEIYVQ